ncbi:MAG: hypothetical protein PVI97_17530 [Candidatus Thiodiazotropha sp.]
MSKKPENKNIIRTINDMGLKAEILSKEVGYDFSTAGGFLQKMPVYVRALTRHPSQMKFHSYKQTRYRKPIIELNLAPL